MLIEKLEKYYVIIPSAIRNVPVENIVCCEFNKKREKSILLEEIVIYFHIQRGKIERKEPQYRIYLQKIYINISQNKGKMLFTGKCQ